MIFIGEAEETWPQFLERVGAGAAPVPLRAGREDRHDARCRRRGSTCSRCGTTPSAASSSRAAARSSASSATSSSPSAAGPGSRRPRRSSPSSRRSRAQEMRIVFIVDDNLIGNKKAIKEVLRDVIAWQQAERLSADLLHRGVDRPGRRRRADGADGRGQLHRRLHRHREPRTRSRSARPRSSRTSAQAGRSLEKVHRIQDAGHGGLVRDDHRLRQRRRDDLRRARSSSSSEARIAALDDRHALGDPQDAAVRPARRPKGGSTRADEPEFGTNVIPLKIGREELRDGYIRVMNDLYEPEAYFDRARGPVPRGPARRSAAAGPATGRRTPGSGSRPSRSAWPRRSACSSG